MIASVRMFTALTMILTAVSAGATPYFNTSPCNEPDQQVQPIHRMPPAFPHAATLLCLEGSVHLRITIDEHGRVDHLQVADSQPPGVFDRAAVRAARGWSYRPACENGEPVPSETSTAIDFLLEEALLQDCPEQPPELDDTTLELLAEIGAFYALLAETQLSGAGPEQVESMLTEAGVPELDDTSLMIWHFHRDALLDGLAFRQESVRPLSETGFPTLLFRASTYESDPQMVETRAALDQIGQELDRYIDRRESGRAKLEADYIKLQHAAGMDEELLGLMIFPFLGDFREGSLQDHFDSLRAQYALMNAAVELLEREQGRWHIKGTQQHFDDPEAGSEFRRILLDLYSIQDQARSDRYDVLRGFEDYFDAD